MFLYISNHTKMCEKVVISINGFRHFICSCSSFPNSKTKFDACLCCCVTTKKIQFIHKAAKDHVG